MKKVIALTLAILFCMSCNAPINKYVYDGFAQGTTYHIAYHSTKELVTQQQIDSILSDFDKSCSIYNKSSLISALNSNQTDSVDIHIEKCVKAASHFYQLSNGLYDITIKPLTKAYGFIDQKAPTHSINIDSILNLIGMDKIKVESGKLIKSNPNVQIDLNSIAQGYSVDLLSDFLSSRGLTDYIVEIGGEIFARGDNRGLQWKVGIEKPIDNSFVQGQNIQAILAIKDKGLTTSGNYRKFFNTESGERINHTINPITGMSSSNDMLSVTVLAQNATMADGYTTAFMVMGKDKSVEYLESNTNIDAMIVYTKNDTIKTYITKGLKDIIKLND